MPALQLFAVPQLCAPEGPGALWGAAFLAACQGPWPERCSPPGAARALLGLLEVQVLLVWCQISGSSYLCVLRLLSSVIAAPVPLITFRYQRLMKSDYYNINFLFCLLSISEKCS